MFDIIVAVVSSLALTWFFLMHKTRADLKDLLNKKRIQFGEDFTLPQERVAGEFKTVVFRDNYVFCHPAGHADVSNGTTADQRNLQRAIDMSQAQGRKLVTLKRPYHLNQSLFSGKYESLNWDMGYATLKSVNSTPFVMLDRPEPTDNSDANVMIQEIWNVENGTFEGNGTGLRCGPTYGNGEGSYFKHISGKNLDLVMDLEFCLNADIIKPSAVNCKKGWLAQFGHRWGGTNSNSQSNNVRLYKPRFYARPDSEYGAKFYGVSGGVVDQPIIEGFKVVYGVFCDGNSSTVVKDFRIINGMHFECVDGSTQAALGVRLAGGKAILDGYFGQYSTIVADVASTGGYMEFEFKNMSYAVPKNGVLFRNGGCTWEGSYSTYQGGAIKNSNFASLVEGVPVSSCGGDSCGYNKFKINEIPR